MILINGQRYECEPAVEAYIKRLEKDWCERNAEIAKLKAENARLEEGYQKSLGVIAADSLPTRVDMYRIKQMCEDTDCENCQYHEGSFCFFSLGVCPMEWDFGGADNA